MSAARKYYDQTHSEPRKSKTSVRPKQPAKPKAKTKQASLWPSFALIGFASWAVASVFGFVFVEIARRETKNWKTVQESAERDIRALQATMQDEFYVRMDDHATAMGMVLSGRAELPEVKVAVAKVATNAVVKPQ